MEKKVTIRNDDGGGRLDAVLSYAQEHGYATVIERGAWKKNTVYEMILSEESENACIGIPQYIIDDGTDLHISSVEEAFAILDSFDAEEDSED